jgi:TRAP-type C4-dicarboxylate transport system permease small subunit
VKAVAAGVEPRREADPAHPAVATPLLPDGPAAPAPLRWLGRMVDWTLIVMGGLMATLIFANVLAHGLLRLDVAVTTELCELLMVWVTFLGAATATRHGAHMRIGEVVERLSGGRRLVADALIQGVVLLTLAILVWYGVGVTGMGWMSMMSVSGWAMAWIYMALPVASAITMVFVGWDLWQIVVLRRPHEQRYRGAAS